MFRGCSRLKEVPNLQLSSSLYTSKFLISRSRIFPGWRRLDQSDSEQRSPEMLVARWAWTEILWFPSSTRMIDPIAVCRFKNVHLEDSVCVLVAIAHATRNLSPWRSRDVCQKAFHFGCSRGHYFRTSLYLGVYIASDNSQPPHLLATFNLELSKGHACEHSSNASCQLPDLLHPGMLVYPPLGLHHYRWPCPTSRG
jgi:hypothetical protein